MNQNAKLNMPSYINIPNGEKPTPTFSAAEMQSRIDKLRVLMSTLNVDSVLMTSIHNINYYSDFLYCSFGRKYGLVINHDSQTSVTANIDGGQPYRRTYGENLVYTDWQNNFYKATATLIKGKQRVGIEFDQVPLEMLEKLKLAMPECEFVDIAAGAMQLRMIKSDEEIAHITKMTAIADIGGQACADAIGVGVPEHEVALHSTQTMIREIAKVWPDGELLDTWTWFQSGMNTDGAHNPVTSKKIERGDILSLNCFPMVAGYYVALERTLFCESATDEQLKVWEVNCKVHDEGKKLIVPGARCCDIAYELNEIYKEHDLLEYRTFGYGHSFGVLCHYYGREAGLELREEVETVLEKDMVVSMEPMLMLPEGMPGEGGYREHDILVLTEDGADNITGFPYGAEHNIISN